MKIKLDENFDPRLAPVLQSHGLDVDTILAERLSGSTDEVVYATCQTLGRVLITLDLDFSNPFRFPPEGTRESSWFDRRVPCCRRSAQHC